MRWHAPLVLLLVASVAHAEPRVVIVQTRDAPLLPGLAVQVQLHAGRDVHVATVQEPTESSMSFAASASAVVNREDATIVVWTASVEESGAASRTLLVFAAGRWPGRALIELVRLDASTPPSEVERIVALKIAGLFDTITSPRAIGASLGVGPSDVAAWRIELGGGIHAERGDRGIDPIAAAIVDRRWGLSGFTLAAGAELGWQPSQTIVRERGTVSLQEIAPGVALAFEWRFGSLTAFVRGRFVASILLASGTTSGGVQGSATVLSPGAGVATGARVPLAGRAEIVLTVGAEAAFTRQQFLVGGAETADLETGRLDVRAGVSIALP